MRKLLTDKILLSLHVNNIFISNLAECLTGFNGVLCHINSLIRARNIIKQTFKLEDYSNLQNRLFLNRIPNLCQNLSITT